MKLKKLPSIIKNNKFNERGLVEIGSGLLVPAYVGSQLGFNTPGKIFLEERFYPKLREVRVLALCPFKACGEFLDFSKINDDMSVKEYRKFWERFNKIVGPVNYETLMPKSKFMIALLDGSHAIDDGLASEVSYFGEKHGHVIGIRSNFRLSENIAAPINPAIRYFIDSKAYNGQFFDGPHAYDNAYKAIKKLADKFLKR